MLQIRNSKEPTVILEWSEFEDILQVLPLEELRSIVAKETGDHIKDLKGLSRKNLIEHLFLEIEV